VSVGWSLHPGHFQADTDLGSRSRRRARIGRESNSQWRKFDLPLQQRVRSLRLADDSVDKRQRKYVYGRSREIVHSRCGARAFRLVC
jgi:hypothetical protein